MGWGGVGWGQVGLGGVDGRVVPQCAPLGVPMPGAAMAPTPLAVTAHPWVRSHRRVLGAVGLSAPPDRHGPH